MRDPIDTIEWLTASELKPNFWNPNAVLSPELKLLEHSILTTGWIQPILINTNGLIIDGFHRWELSRRSKAIQARYAGLVPCARLDVSDAEAMLITVRINRAKGTHVAARMSHLVNRLLDTHGYTIEQIADGIGGSAKEVELLRDPDIFTARALEDAPYSRSWVPHEGEKSE